MSSVEFVGICTYFVTGDELNEKAWRPRKHERLQALSMYSMCQNTVVIPKIEVSCTWVIHSELWYWYDDVKMGWLCVIKKNWSVINFIVHFSNMKIVFLMLLLVIDGCESSKNPLKVTWCGHVLFPQFSSLMCQILSGISMFIYWFVQSKITLESVQISGPMWEIRVKWTP